MVRMGYYVGAAFYRRGCKKIFDVEPDYVYLVQEQEPPYLCSLVGIEPAGRELGARKVARGLAVWKSCVAANRWPGYPNRVAYVEIPAWEVAREEVEPMPEGHAYTYEQMGWSREQRDAARAFDTLPE